MISKYNSRRKGNPNWGRPMTEAQKADVQPTEFEKQLVQHGIFPTLPDMLSSPILTKWVKNHYRVRYVPEDLLEAMNLKLDWGWVEN